MYYCYYYFTTVISTLHNRIITFFSIPQVLAAFLLTKVIAECNIKIYMWLQNIPIHYLSLPRLRAPKHAVNWEERLKHKCKQLHYYYLFSGGAAVRNPFPLVRRSSVMVVGRPEPLARPLPRLLSLELFNPETDDMDSDSSGVSSPDSVSSVISVLTEEPSQLVTSTSASQQAALGNTTCCYM
jgi:hypothetical protein